MANPVGAMMGRTLGTPLVDKPPDAHSEQAPAVGVPIFEDGDWHIVTFCGHVWRIFARNWSTTEAALSCCRRKRRAVNV
jgi:hypothetical protein